MPVFLWQGTTRSGEVKKGEIEAKSLDDAERRLDAQRITIKKLKKKPKDLLLKMPGSSGVQTKDVVVFTRQLATMIDAGLPIVQALTLLANQEANPFFKAALKDVRESVETGNTFAESLKKHPKIFDALYVNLVAAGEVGGVLDSILQRLATHIEKAEKLKQKVKSAMVYPISVMIIAILVMAILLYKVIPTFEEMFANFGNAELPGPTQVVIDLSHAFIDNFGWFLLAAIGIPILFGWAMKQEGFRKGFDRAILKAPIIGNVLRKAAVARFTRTLGTMLSSGVPILDALDIVASASGNKTVESGILYAKSKISEGQNLADPLLETKIFPEMVVQMIAVGEATGAMDTMLGKIADFYEEEVDVAVEGLTQLIEPIMMVFLGGMVGGMLIAMYLPIFSLADTVKE